jgi:NAD(P)H-dependent flavin oxidoreductase YrpB (nitropropane dioxygenase family)
MRLRTALCDLLGIEHPIVQSAAGDGGGGTAISDGVTGLWARYVRNIRNTYVSEYDASGTPVFPRAHPSRAAQDIFAHAGQPALPEWYPMPTGQSLGLVHDLPGAGEVVERIVREAREVLERLPR